MTLEKNEANKRLIEQVQELEKKHDVELSNTQKILSEGEEINFREVIMHTDERPLIYAISHIPLKRCSKDVCADLIRADIPIGRILKNYHIESRREIHNIFIEKPNERLKELFKTDEDMLARDYVIINNDEILMWIKEVFPISYFR